MASELHKYSGKIVSIKERTTKKGVALGIMIESEKGNKAWFMAWTAPWANVSDGYCTPMVLEGQEVEILSPPPDPARNSVQTDEKTGNLMIFLAPNPKLEKAGPVTPEMQRMKHYSEALDGFSLKRLGRAMALFYDEMNQWLHDKDREFVTSLADGARQYQTVTEKQKPYVVKILARYAAENSKWRSTVDASIKNAEENPEHEPPEQHVTIAQEDF